MVALLGWLGFGLLFISAIPQMMKCWHDGNADGLSWAMLVLLALGFILMLMHVIASHASIMLVINYGASLFGVALLLWFKLFPRR